MSFHVFLSHSSADKPAVEELARRLTKEGIQAWLDKWNLIPGDAWQPAIEKALAESETCAVFVGPSGLGPWQNEEMRAAIDRRVRESARRFRVIPVLLPGAERAERSSLPTFLAATTWVEFRDSLDDADAFHRLVCGIRGLEPGPGPGQAFYEGQCPYRGLRVFDVNDAVFFFGREALVQWLLNEVRPAIEGQPISRFLAIVGASGSGKSSVARAGMAAGLKHDAVPGSSRWPIAIFRPGSDPLESLAVALSRVVNVGQGVSALADLIGELQRNEKALHLTARQSLPENASGIMLVILVDQFEEVFTLCRNEDLRGAFIRNLLYAAKVAQGQTLVILTMRADFYAKCAANADLAAAFSDHHVLVGSMTDDELRRAIERPTQLVGCELESGLVDLLMQDVRRQAGALPLLQHALLELWNKRDGRRLTVKAYQEIGKLEGALQRRADATLNAFSQDEQELSRRIFLRLTQPGEGTEDTKRRASMQELLSLSGKSTAEEDIIQKLADASLLTTEGDIARRDVFVEVAHEALIRSWPKLRQWIDADRTGLRTRTRLTEATRDWKNAGRDQAYLYTGARLAVAEEWEAAHPHELSADEDEFLVQSLETQRQRKASELEAARKLAEALRERAEEAEKREQEQKEAAEKLQVERAVAEQHARVANEQLRKSEHLLYDARMYVAAKEYEGGNLKRTLENIEEYLPSKTASATGEDLRGFDWYYLWHLTHNELLTLKAPAPTGPAELSPDGQRLVTFGPDNVYKLWDTRTLQQVATLQGFNEKAYRFEFSPDSRRFASRTAAGFLKLWNASTGQEIASIDCNKFREAKPKEPGNTAARFTAYSAPVNINFIRFTSDNKYLAIDLQVPAVLVVFDAETGHEVRTMRLSSSEGIGSWDFSPDGQKLLIRLSGGDFGLWKLADGAQIPFAPPVEKALGLQFSPSGDLLAATSHDGTLKVWRTSNGEAITSKNGLSFSTWVAFSPDGKQLLTSDGPGYKLWDTTKWDAKPLRASRQVRTQPVFLPNRNLLAAGADDGVVLWDTGTGEETVLNGEAGPNYGVQFSSNGRCVMASGPSISTMKLLDTSARREVVLQGGENAGFGSFSPSGELIAAPLDDGTIGVWESSTGLRIKTLFGHKGAAKQPRFLAEGKQILADGDDGTIKIWSSTADSQPERAKLDGIHRAITVLVSSDGQNVAAEVNGSVVLKHLDNGEEFNLKDERGSISGVDFSPDDRWFRTYCTWNVGYESKGAYKLWDVATGREVRLEEFDDVISTAFSSNGKTFAAALRNGKASVWDASLWRQLRSFSNEKAKVTAIALSPDRERAITGDANGGIALWSVRDAQATAATSRIESDVEQVKFTPDGRHAFAFGYSRAELLDTATGQTVALQNLVDYRLRREDLLNSNYLALPKSDGTMLLAIDSKREIQLENSSPGDVFWTSPFSRSGKLFVADAANGITVWETATGRLLFTTKLSGPTSGPIMSADEKYLVAGTKDGKIYMWQTAGNGELIINAHSSAVEALVFTNDGKRLVSAGDKEVKIWDVYTGQELLNLAGHAGRVGKLVFIADDRRLISVADDGEVRIWNTATEAQVQVQAETGQ